MFSIRSVFVALLVVSGVVQKQQQQQQQGGTACGMVTAFIMPATNAVARTTQDQWRSFSSLVPIKPSFLHNGRTAIRATDNGIGADEGQGSSDNDDQDSIPLLPPVGQSSSKVSAMDVNDSSKLPNVLSKRFEIQYTCKRCDTRNSHKISRKAYYNGVVIVACKGCNSAHMIADNLGWYDYAGGFEGDNNIEEYFQTRGVGDAVTRVSKEVFELEDLLERTGTVGSNTDMLDSSDTTSMQ